MYRHDRLNLAVSFRSRDSGFRSFSNFKERNGDSFHFTFMEHYLILWRGDSIYIKFYFLSITLSLSLSFIKYFWKELCIFLSLYHYVTTGKSLKKKATFFLFRYSACDWPVILDGSYISMNRSMIFSPGFVAQWLPHLFFVFDKRSVIVDVPIHRDAP